MIRARVVLNTASLRSQPGIEACFTDAEMAQLPSRVDPVPSIGARLAAKVAITAILDVGPDVGPDDRAGHPDFAMVLDLEASWTGHPGGGSHLRFRGDASDLRLVQVLASPNGAPLLVLDPARYPDTGPGWVSLSHDGGLAAALVVLNC